MNDVGKILTVSYGTFSCRLEGFDEPLHTMKAIAEYFRDLAADDRSFGTETPTPDAAMVLRLAERAVNRRVETRIEENSMILRTGEAMQTPDVAPSAPAPNVPPTRPWPAAAGLSAEEEESVASKLQRIRAVISQSASQASDPTLTQDEASAPVFRASLADAGQAGDDGTEAAVAPQAGWDTARHDAGPAGSSDAREPDAPEKAATLPAIGTPAALAAGAEEDDATIAPEQFDWSILLRDVGPELPSPSAQAEAAFEDRDGQADLIPLADVPEIPALLAGVSDEAPQQDPPGTAEDVALLSSVFPGELPGEGPPALTAMTDEDLPDSAAADADAFLASLAIPAPEDHDVLDGAFAEDIPGKDAPAPIPAGNDDGLDDNGDPELTQGWDAATFPAAGKDASEAFADLSGPAASDDAWPTDPDLPEPAVAAAEPDAVSDELRRARQRVLVERAPESADVASSATGNATDAPVEGDGESDAEATPKAEGRSRLEDIAKEAEDVTRLLRQTNSEMDEPGNRRRLSTMAHLKAAVAATVADRQSAGGETRSGEATRMDRYRADLARVVRPSRPDGSMPTERPEPLVLASEQRIDRPAADGAINRALPGWISPTNLALGDTPDDSDAPAGTDNIFAATPDFADFAEFAEHLWARDIPDLLEAAAAYTACMEGRPHFTRRHLIRHVAAATGVGSVTREDCRRSFGTLLRQGKIAQVERGQFAITDSSHYLAEARRMTRQAPAGPASGRRDR